MSIHQRWSLPRRTLSKGLGVEAIALRGMNCPVANSSCEGCS